MTIIKKAGKQEVGERAVARSVYDILGFICRAYDCDVVDATGVEFDDDPYAEIIIRNFVFTDELCEAFISDDYVVGSKVHRDLNDVLAEALDDSDFFACVESLDAMYLDVAAKWHSNTFGGELNRLDLVINACKVGE